MSPTDDTQPTRGRPVLKRIGIEDLDDIEVHAQHGQLWFFCGEYEGKEQQAADGAQSQHGSGIYKVFPSGSWPGGYLRD